MKRRTVLLAGAGVGLVALGAGGWVAWRQNAALPNSALDALWSTTFESPAGPPLAMNALRGSRLLVNFWATWCAPCVKEMPELDRFWRARAPSGWQVAGIAIDRPEAVRAFLDRQPVGFPIGIAGMEGMNLLRQLGNPAGLLPYTLVLDSEGHLVDRKLGPVEEDQLTEWGRQPGR